MLNDGKLFDSHGMALSYADSLKKVSTTAEVLARGWLGWQGGGSTVGRTHGRHSAARYLLVILVALAPDREPGLPIVM